MPIPRVGSTENDSAPLSTSIISTPSRNPPRKVLLRIDHEAGDFIGTSSGPATKVSSQTSRATSVRVVTIGGMARYSLTGAGGAGGRSAAAITGYAATINTVPPNSAKHTLRKKSPYGTSLYNW